VTRRNASVRSLRIRSALWVVLPFMVGVSAGLGGYFGWLQWVLAAASVGMALWGAQNLIQVAWYSGRQDAVTEIEKMQDRRQRWPLN
jgi:hypothetical protein